MAFQARDLMIDVLPSAGGDPLAGRCTLTTSLGCPPPSQPSTAVCGAETAADVSLLRRQLRERLSL
jgi:hypothetical protein